MRATITPYPFGKYLLASGLVLWELDGIGSMVVGHAALADFATNGGKEFEVSAATLSSWSGTSVSQRSIRYNETTKRVEVCATTVLVTPDASAMSGGTATGMIYTTRSLDGASLVLPIAGILLEADSNGPVVAGTLYVARPENGILFTL